MFAFRPFETIGVLGLLSTHCGHQPQVRSGLSRSTLPNSRHLLSTEPYELAASTQFIEVVTPPLGHLHPLIPVKSTVICTTSGVTLAMSQGSLNGIGALQAALVQQRRCRRPQTMSRDLILLEAHTSERGILRVLQRQRTSTIKQMVPRRGLEPPRPCERQHLKLVRLPILPPGHGASHFWQAAALKRRRPALSI